MRTKSRNNNSITREVKHHIYSFCNIRDPKKRHYIIQKLSRTLTNTAKAELGRKPEEITFSAVQGLVKQYLFRLRTGFCIHDKRQDSYVLLNSEVLKMKKYGMSPQELCGSCISPRVCKLKSAIMNSKDLAGLFINIKKFV